MILIANGRLITRDSANPYIENGGVAVSGTKIVETGETAALRAKYPDAEFVDAKGGVIMPAFINAHSHIYSALARGLAMKGHNPTNFYEVLDGMWWRLDRNLTLEDTRRSAYTTYIDSIKTGCTTVFDHHASYCEIEGSLFAIEKVAKELGIRTVLCYEVSERDGQEKCDAAIRENADFIAHCEKEQHPLVRAMFGMHALFTISDRTMEQRKDRLPYPRVRRHERRVRHAANLRNAPGEPPAKPWDSRGKDAPWALHPRQSRGDGHHKRNKHHGCEQPGVQHGQCRRLLAGAANVSKRHPRRPWHGRLHLRHDRKPEGRPCHTAAQCLPNVGWGEATAMLFLNNAKIAARYFEDPLGVLKPGAAADVIVMDYKPFTPFSAENIDGHILFGMAGRQCETTMCAGKILMRDRVLTCADEEAVNARTLEVSRALWKRLNG